MCVINLFTSNEFKARVKKIEPRILLMLSIVMLNTFFSQAQQWQTSSGNLHFSTGSVGIGTTTPNSPLEVKSENSNNDLILARFIHRANTAEAGAGIQLGGKNDDSGFGAKILGYSNPNLTHNSRMSIFTSSGLNTWNLGLTQDKDGNIGIGTTTPKSPLEATSENSDSDVILARFIHRANTTEAGAGIQLGGKNDDRGFGAKILGYSNPNLNHNSRMSIFTSSGLNTWNLGLTQDKDGNIGIGTTTPKSRLEATSENSDSDVILARFIHRANTTEAGAGIQLGGKNDDKGFGAKILGYSNPNLNHNSRMSIFTSSGLNTWNLGLTQDKDGNVGIGTISPSQKLSVDGTINAEEILLEDVAGADFVFEEDYDLRSLEETEQFIKANKHLPEVPSAAEMAEEGLALKEMNILLLQKVEELTLHLIRMEKEAKTNAADFEAKLLEQEKQIEALKAKQNK
ncbi:MAG: hypothetical protein R8G66_12200 [Cytophagales bacterium]|nr:hypothetical protein [Cytophagales bacterium]